MTLPTKFYIEIHEIPDGTYEPSTEFNQDVREVYGINPDLLFEALNQGNVTKRAFSIFKTIPSKLAPPSLSLGTMRGGNE